MSLSVIVDFDSIMTVGQNLEFNFYLQATTSGKYTVVLNEYDLVKVLEVSVSIVSKFKIIIVVFMCSLPWPGALSWQTALYTLLFQITDKRARS